MSHDFNAQYDNENLSRVAFPLGGLGAGMICVEGSGAFSHVSLRHEPDVFNEPLLFAALHVGSPSQTLSRIVEGPVPMWKAFGQNGAGNGHGPSKGRKSWGLPRFSRSTFTARMPFAELTFTDEKMPVEAKLTAWSPFVPSDADRSSLPMAVLEYTFTNTTSEAIEATFSFHAENFMAVPETEGASVGAVDNGFVLRQPGSDDRPYDQGCFVAVDPDGTSNVDTHWFRGGWFDPLSMLWKKIDSGSDQANPPVDDEPASPGGSLYARFTLEPKQSTARRVLLAWFVPKSNLRVGKSPEDPPAEKGTSCCRGEGEKNLPTYVPWYAGRFGSINDVVDYARKNLDTLRADSRAFTDAFYSQTLPAEVVEAVAANLTILKSPTTMRQTDGRYWGWEGCCDGTGCCAGSCTHVYNYQQALAHVFPELERSRRITEFGECQDARGHQDFRACLPIRPTMHTFHAAADGQLGGIMQTYRDWRISGDTPWLRTLWPKVKQSLDYCIATWDPRRTGTLEEPHHNTYDIEFWGPDGMCTGIYLGALKAAAEMARGLDEDAASYETLFKKGKHAAETQLYNGEYFYQQVRWTDLDADDPVKASTVGIGMNYSAEAVELLKQEGPKYQYGTGCLADGVLGDWNARVCGLGGVLDEAKVESHLLTVYKHNMRGDLHEHVNPQRPTYALNGDGGLVLCTWPRGGELSLPFPYAHEVWTGYEYQVAAHLAMFGHLDEALDIVRTARKRYDGTVRNPFNEYECGHWYARAMSSYALIQALTGLRYDRLTKTVHLDPKVDGDFTAFLSTETGFGTAGLRDGQPFVEVTYGQIEVEEVRWER